MNYTEKLFKYIENSPSPFHAVHTTANELKAAGYTELYEKDEWSLTPGGKYYVCRNGSSIIAFKVPQDITAFNIVAAHCDSPTFKIKENAEMNGVYTTLNTEKYGGMIYSTWLDRPLSVAGRVIVKDGGRYLQKLVNIDRDLLIIPNLAIHMDRTANDGKKLNPQTDLLPLYSIGGEKGRFIRQIAQAAGVNAEDIMGHDLFLYNREKGTVLGADCEFVASPKLDDLQCAFSALTGLLENQEYKSVPVVAIFDNEEVGSQTKQGAASTFLKETLKRIVFACGGTETDYFRAVSQSFMISADNAHAVHPNVPSVADPTNRPVINGGIVIKYNANQRYTSDGVSAAIFKGMLKDLGLNSQTYHNRSDVAGGGTLGNISNTKVSLDTVDIGLPQLAMHSAYETAGIKDTEDFIAVCRHFFGVKMEKTDLECVIK